MSPQRRDGKGNGNINRVWWVQPPQAPSPHILQSDRASPWRELKLMRSTPKTLWCECELFPKCWCLHTDTNFLTQLPHEQKQEEKDAKTQVYVKSCFSWCKDGEVIVSVECLFRVAQMTAGSQPRGWLAAGRGSCAQIFREPQTMKPCGFSSVILMGSWATSTSKVSARSQKDHKGRLSLEYLN